MDRVFSVTMLDIPDIERGVGLALVLQTPGGCTYLYDTGSGYPVGDGWEHDHNSGRDLIMPWLEARGISEVDGVIISHAHYDHFGGLLWLVDHLPIRWLIDSGYEFGGVANDHYRKELADYEGLRRSFQAKADGYQAATAGARLELDQELHVEVIAPPAGFFQDPQIADRADWNPAAHYLLNSNSVMLRIQHGDVVLLLPGDIEREDQARLLLPSVAPGKLKSDVLIAPGHGLHTHPDFVAVTRPTLVAVSLFGRWLGACTACEEFEAIGAEVHVTGRDGEITIVSDGGSARVGR